MSPAVVEIIGIAIIIVFGLLDGWGIFMLTKEAIGSREPKPKQPLGGTVRKLEP
jgi:hypothetical protein